MAQDLIYNIVKGKNTLKPELTSSATSAKKLTQETDKFALSFKGAGLAANAMRTAIVGSLAAFAVGKVIRDANDLQNALIGLRSVAFNTGESVSAVEETAKSLARDGLIPLTDASTALKNLLASGLNLEQSIKLLDTFKNSAAFNRKEQQDLGTAINRASEGFKNRLSVLVDNVGITKNLSQIEREYTRETGKSTAGIDEKVRSQILANGLIKEGALFQGDYNKLLGTFQGAQSKAESASKFLSAAVGELITKNPELIQQLFTVGESIEGLTLAVNNNAPAISNLVGIIAKLPLTILEGWINLTSFAVAGTGTFAKVIADAGTAGVKTSNEIKQLTLSVAGLEGSLAKAEAQGASPKIIESIKARIIAEKELLKSKRETLIQIQKEAEATAEDDKKELAKDPNASKKVEFAKAVNVLLAQLEDERLTKEAELAQRKIEQDLLSSEEKLLSIETQLQLESDLKAIYADEERVKKAKQLEELGSLESNYSKRRLSEIQKVTKAEVALAQQKEQLKNSILANGFAFGAALAKDGSKAQFLIQKAGALAQVIIADGQARAAALAQTSVIPYPANLAALAQMQSLITANTALASGTIAAAAIKGFQEGGPLSQGTRSGDAVLFRGNKDEAVFTRAQQSELFNIANGKKESSNEAMTSQVISISIDGREIARAVRDQVKDGFKIA